MRRFAVTSWSVLCTLTAGHAMKVGRVVATIRELLMSPTALKTLSTFGVGVLCITLCIMALAIFFTALSWVGNRGAKPEAMSVRGVLKKGTWATVHMTGAKTFERVRFVGFTNAANVKTHLPFDLHGMVILEDVEGRRFLVRAKAIQMIVIEPGEEETLGSKGV